MQIILEKIHSAAVQATERRMPGRLLIVLNLLVFATLFFFTPLHAIPTEKRQNVLVIYSTHDRMPWQRLLRSGLGAGLEAADSRIVLFEENLDAARFPDPGHSAAFALYLKGKYKNKPIDVLVTQGLPASALMNANKDLFPEAYLLLLAPGADVEQKLGSERNVSVLMTQDDIIASFDSMVSVTQSKNVVVLGETRTKFVRHYAVQLIKERPSGRNGVNVDYLLNLPLEEMKRRVEKLPKNSAIFYLLMFQDGAGKTITPLQAAKMLAGNASAPMFSHWETLLGSGIAGGYMLSAERIGLAAAEEVKNLLAGKPSALDRKSSDRLFADLYDWRALTRYGIDQSRLPQGSRLLYYKPSLWSQYRIHIIIAGALILILSSLSALLAHALMGRRRAVKELEIERSHLEERVADRTKDLSRSNEQLEMLNAEISEKNRKLEKALAEINTLRGFLPICSNCKKVRDDHGYWNQIESYIQERSEAVFSHSICPECMKEIYPDMADKVLSKMDDPQ